MMKKDKKQQKKGVNKSNFHRDTASSTSFVDVIDTNETILTTAIFIIRNCLGLMEEPIR